MKAILCPLKLYSVALWVFFPDTNLCLPQFIFKYNLKCMVSWMRRSKILPHLTLQVAALLIIIIYDIIFTNLHLNFWILAERVSNVSKSCAGSLESRQ